MADMRALLNRRIARLWIWIVTLGAHDDVSSSMRFQPGDEERLIQILINMNATLARATWDGQS